MSHRRKILVVDDQATTRDLLILVLEMADFEAAFARDGQEALNLLEEVDPAVVLTDIHMPGMNGLQLATGLRERRRAGDLPVVAMSADLEMVQLLQGDERFFSVLPKPVDATNLIAVVREASHQEV